MARAIEVDPRQRLISPSKIVFSVIWSSGTACARVERSEMLKALRTTLALIAITGAIAAPAYPQTSARPQESPWAMRAPAAEPHGVPTLSAKERAAEEAAEKGTPAQQAL